MLELIVAFVGEVNSLVWGKAMIIAILGVGFILSFALLFMPLRKIGYAFRLLWRAREPRGEGDISGFNALMTAMSATVGTGNIAGVATAIAIGGPGALFWMWITALIGMATKFSEAVCAVHYRETSADGKHIGGPMFYIKNGLGKKWGWLGFLYALFGALAALGIGNMVQSNTIAATLDNFGVHPLLTAGVLILLVGLVLIGGITRIASWAGKLVPFMIVVYVGLGIIILLINFTDIPSAIELIVTSAFTGTAATGGFVGSTMLIAIQFGVARGIFSNEAGLGSASIAHAAAKTNSPVRQGHIAMLGTFIDTIIVCSITGLIIVITGTWIDGATGVDLTSTSFDRAVTGGNYVVSIALLIFAFTTILGWSYYGEKCWQYLFGLRSILAYRIIWLVAVFIGVDLDLVSRTSAGIDFIWLLSDTMNALMALPNLIALLLLMPVVIRLTREYYSKK